VEVLLAALAHAVLKGAGDFNFNFRNGAEDVGGAAGEGGGAFLRAKVRASCGERPRSRAPR
jgi:hypothetical protein